MLTRKSSCRCLFGCSLQVLFLLAQASAQQPAETALSLATSDAAKSEYVIEFFTVTIPVDKAKIGAAKTYEKFLTGIDPTKIEVQGNGDRIQDSVLMVRADVSKMPPAFLTGPQIETVPSLIGTPVLVATLAETQRTDLIQKIKAGEHNNLLQSPTITVLANQPVTIFDGSILPFVTAFTEVSSEGGSGVALQPEVKWIGDGSIAQISVTPVGDILRLELKADVNNIIETETIEVAGAKQTNADKTFIQIPVVDAKHLRISSDMNSGESLFVVPSWKPVSVQPSEVSAVNQSRFSYVSNFIGLNKTNQTTARIAFLVRVYKIDK